MTTVAYPMVYAALVTAATTALSGACRVVDGYDLSNDPGDVMEIGVPSIADVNAISAGDFSQDAATFGRAAGGLKETGTINGIVLARNGQGDLTTARTAAFGYLTTLGTAIRADRAMGVTAFDLVAKVTSGDVAEDQVDGATVAVSFTVTYAALI